MSIYDFSVKGPLGFPVKLDKYKGKVLLIVNSASNCGYTPQYAGLQKLYEQFGPEHFVVLAFPSNQFANQEPGDDASIQKFCSVNYGITFPVMMKIDVNGSSADPLFAYLKQAAPGTLGNTIKWNFTKFLVDANGQVVERYAPATPPEKLEAAIAGLIAQAQAEPGI